MKRLVYLSLACFCFFLFEAASCKKDAMLGTWDMVIKDTPEGDAEGTVEISKDGDNYMATMNVEGEEVPLENLKVEDNNISFTFEVQGYELEASGVIDGDALSGKVSVAGYDFPLEGKKQK